MLCPKEFLGGANPMEDLLNISLSKFINLIIIYSSPTSKNPQIESLV